MSFVKFFLTTCAEMGITPDAVQLQLAQLLEDKARELHEYTRIENFFEHALHLFTPKIHPQGFYIHGSVGRGKTMLMDMFARYCAGMPLRRAHFHEFMQDVHSRIGHEREVDAKDDALTRAAASIAQESRILCFDEFEVTSIADAMIMGRLFTKLFEDGVVLITTSNLPAQELYKDGLNRVLFEPFLEVLAQHVAEFELESPHDYRFLHEASRPNYYMPLGKRTTTALKKALGRELSPIALDVGGRTFPILGNTTQKYAYASFDEACLQARGVPDYEPLAQKFTHIALDGVPQFTAADRSAAQRFKILVDILYDHNVSLYIGAQCAPEAMFEHLQHPEHYARTISRLVEMGGGHK